MVTRPPDKWLLGILLFLLLKNPFGFAQPPQVSIQYTDVPLQIDGLINEEAWQQAAIIPSFLQHTPTNGQAANNQTQVRILFDDRFLYIAAHCQQASDKGFVVQSLKRDFNFSDNDAFEIYIDAFTDANSGFNFGVNPFGVQRDGIIPNGGIKKIDLTWDGRWFAEVAKQADGWTVEIAIPFKTLRFNPDLTSWNINFARSALRQNEISTWVPIPRGFSLATLALMGQLHWVRPPPYIRHNVALIPYLAAKVEKAANTPPQAKPLAGADLKIGLSSAVHLDLTVNPDFSQVDVDQQIIDLNRFELFFPEKRLFFLENSDLFTNIGNSRVRPFFSRRIGSLNQAPVPIAFGGRLSGKLGKTWKVGVMDVQTKAKAAEQINAQNYLIASVQKSLFSSSSISAFLTNRQALNGTSPIQNDFSRIGGFEFDYRSKDSKITGKSFLHYAINPEQLKDAMAYSAKARYRSKSFSLFLGIDRVGENYLPELGYVPRLFHENQVQDTSIRVSYMESRANGYYRHFLPQNKTLDYLEAELRIKVFTDPAFQYQEHKLDANFTLAMVNQSQLTMTLSDYSQVLYFPFTLKGLDRPFPAGNYPNQRMLVEYDTGKRQALQGKVSFGYSGEFMGNHLSIIGITNYRFHRYAVFGLNFSYEELLDFPSAYGAARFTLLGSQLEVSLNKNLFFTTFLQYNTQIKNFNVNSRFNWRFHPLSDLFVVYTSNYLSDGFDRKNNALVIKLNYWLNL